MTRRAPLPMITECVEKQKQTEGGVSRSRLLRASYPFMVICVLCLAHVHLQFGQMDLRIQQSQLQAQRTILVRQEQALVRQNEALCDPVSLRRVAKFEHGMQEVEIQTADVFAHVPADIQEKYSRPLAPKQSDVMVAQLRREREKPGISTVLFSLFDSSRAIASTPSDNL